MKGILIWDTKRSLEGQLCNTLPRDLSIEHVHRGIACDFGSHMVVKLKDRSLLLYLAVPFISEVLVLELLPTKNTQQMLLRCKTFDKHASHGPVVEPKASVPQMGSRSKDIEWV